MEINYKKCCAIAFLAITISVVALGATQLLENVTCLNCTIDNPTFKNFTFPSGNGTNNHSNLTNLNWSVAGHILDTDLVFQKSDINNPGGIHTNTDESHILFSDGSFPTLTLEANNTNATANLALSASGFNDDAIYTLDIFSSTFNTEILNTIDASSNSIQYSFYPSGNLTTITDGNISHTGYSGTGKRTICTDANGLFYPNASTCNPVFERISFNSTNLNNTGERVFNTTYSTGNKPIELSVGLDFNATTANGRIDQHVDLLINGSSVSDAGVHIHVQQGDIFHQTITYIIPQSSTYEVNHAINNQGSLEIDSWIESIISVG